MIGTIRKYFLAGILALLPVYVTGWILFKVFSVVDRNVRPFIAKWAGYEIPGLGFLATVLFVLLIGIFASNIIGRSFLNRLEEVFAKVPLFSRIYISVKQIGEGIIGKRNLFERAVLFEYPRPGCWAVGFVTGRHEGVLARQQRRQFEHVFVPTTPNPTSGFLLFLPTEDLTDLGLSVEDALKLVISGGAVSPPSQIPASPAPSGRGSKKSVAATGKG